jgi:hypothetical protein
LFTKFVEREKQAPWEGELIELFTKARTGQPERISFEGGVLGVGGRTPLSLRIYAFVPESKPPLKISRVKVWDADAWYGKPDEFAILTDTSFHLEALPLVDGRPTSWSGTELIACVNKRSRTPVCDGDTGGVIEDPLSGQPSLLMMVHGGPPEWLKRVPTEICVEGQDGHVVKVPESSQPIPLDQKFGTRWCSARSLTLDYVALREEGIRIGSLEGKKQLDPRFAPDNSWRMWADRPKAAKVGAQEVWVQRIILHPPKSEASSLPPPPPSSSSSFELVLAGQLPSPGSITTLWYGPVPSAADGEAKCEDERLVVGKSSWSREKLVKAQALKVEAPGSRRLKATEPDKSRLNFKEPLAIIARVGPNRFYCGVARPVPGADREFEVALAISEEKTVSVQEKLKPITPPAPPSAPPTADTPKADTPKADTTVFPPGGPVSVVFKSRDAAATEHKLQHAKVQNEDGAFADVSRKQLQFTLPEESGFAVTKCEAKKVNCSSDGANIELLPKTGVAISSPVVVTIEFAPLKRNIALTIQREGPALVSIQQVSKGKAVDVIDPQREKGSMLTKTIQWTSGDKLRVRPVDDDFQEVSEITVDGKASEKRDEISIKPDAKAVAIVIKTADRLFSVPVTVSTSPKADVSLKLETRTDKTEIPLSVDVQAKAVTLEAVKPDQTLTVEPLEKDRVEVVTMILRGGKTLRPIVGPTLKFERSDFQGGNALALNLDVSLRDAAFTVPDKFRLQPVVHLGKRELLLKNCKVELEGFLGGSSFVHKGGGYTEVAVAQDKRAAKTSSYAVKVIGDASICGQLTSAQPIQAAQLDQSRLQPNGTLTVSFRVPSRRAFVGVVSLSKDIRSSEPIWREALKAVRAVFDAGAEKGKYLSGAVHGPEGQLLVTTGDSADFSQLELEKEVFKSSKMDDLIGSSDQSLGALVTRIAKHVADFEGNVDVLIVADEQFAPCGWSDAPFAKGSRTALVRLTGSAGKGKEIVTGSAVRLCDSTERSEKAGVVAEVEVVPEKWTRQWPQERQLELAISEAASKGFGIKIPLQSKQQ